MEEHMVIWSYGDMHIRADDPGWIGPGRSSHMNIYASDGIKKEISFLISISYILPLGLWWNCIRTLLVQVVEHLQKYLWERTFLDLQ